MTHVLWYNLIFIPLVQLEAINLNYKNLIVTTIFKKYSFVSRVDLE